MTDLVERLRHCQCAYGDAGDGYVEQLAMEAADDIERLRTELEKERAACAAWWSACEKQKTEIERLWALLNDEMYIKCKADYLRGHLSHAGFIESKERTAHGKQEGKG